MLISCRHYVALSTDAREGKLSLWDRTRAGMHRAVCSYCQAFEASVDKTLELLHDQPAEPPTEAMEAELLKELRAKLPRRS